MNKLLYIYLLLSLSFLPTLYAQDQTYTVTKNSFSTARYDEFAPVWYWNGLVFCSNR